MVFSVALLIGLWREKEKHLVKNKKKTKHFSLILRKIIKTKNNYKSFKWIANKNFQLIKSTNQEPIFH